MTMQAAISVIGVGGGGGNAVGAMIRAGFEGVGFAVANTDAQALARSEADVRIQLGPQTTRGRGAGGDPMVGYHSAQSSVAELSRAAAGADLVFVTAGLGGGTGTGAAAVVAAAAREQGALTINIITTPFPFEGHRRSKHAEAGLAALEQHVDALLVIPNDRLLDVAGEDLSMLDAFAQADEVLCEAVRGITELVTSAGMVNLDFADVATVLRNGGRAMMGIGRARGPGRAAIAAEAAMTSPLLREGSIEGASSILINFRAGPDLGLREVHEAAAAIEAQASEDADVIFGVVHDAAMEGTLELTLVATGLGAQAAAAKAAAQASAASPPGGRSVHGGAPAGYGAQQALPHHGPPHHSPPHHGSLQHTRSEPRGVPHASGPATPRASHPPAARHRPTVPPHPSVSPHPGASSHAAAPRHPPVSQSGPRNALRFLE
jgi:cell division protein FtsZ